MNEPDAGRSGRPAGTGPATRVAPGAGGASSQARTIVVLLLATVLALAPVLVHPLPPLGDYPNHLARMHVIATIGSDPNLARYYDVHWHIIPNLVMDLIVPPLTRMTGIYRAGQIYVVLSLALVASGGFVLHRALFGGWSILGLAALPFLYNRIFVIGLMNYWFGVGLALWAAAAWIALRERSWAVRLPAATAFAVALFFSHLFAVGLYGLTLLAFELWRLSRGRRAAPADVPGKACPGLDPGCTPAGTKYALGVRLADFAAAGLQFLPLAALLAVSPTWGLSGNNAWSLPAKLEGLYFAASAYSDALDLALATGVAALLAGAALRGWLRVHPAGRALLALGALVYLAMPNILFDTYAADERLPAALVFVALGFMSLDLPPGRARTAVALALLCILAVRIGEVGVAWNELARQQAEVRASTGSIPQRGARVLVGSAEQMSDHEAFDFALAHAACLALIERSAFVANAFVFPGKQIMEVRPAFRQIAELVDGDLPTIDQLADARQSPEPPEGTGAYWRQWPRNFDYLYLMYTGRGDANPFPELLTLRYGGERFRLYEIRKAAP